MSKVRTRSFIDLIQLKAYSELKVYSVMPEISVSESVKMEDRVSYFYMISLSLDI